MENQTQAGEANPGCLNCLREEEFAPLIAVNFRGVQLWICAQCLPTLIHRPEELAGKLPGGGFDAAGS